MYKYNMKYGTRSNHKCVIRSSLLYILVTRFSNLSSVQVLGACTAMEAVANASNLLGLDVYFVGSLR